jgi:hypothetical protein
MGYESSTIPSASPHICETAMWRDVSFLVPDVTGRIVRCYNTDTMTVYRSPLVLHITPFFSYLDMQYSYKSYEYQEKPNFQSHFRLILDSQSSRIEYEDCPCRHFCPKVSRARLKKFLELVGRRQSGTIVLHLYHRHIYRHMSPC